MTSQCTVALPHNRRLIMNFALWKILTLLMLNFGLGECEVLVTPSVFVSIPGGSATFFCSTSPFSNDDIVNVTWLVNGRSLEASGLDNVGSSGFGILLFSPVSSSDNMTDVQCSTVHVSRLSSLSSPSRLLIQDVLHAVSSLRVQAWNSTTLSLTWEPPFTLDISGINPDISGYCVDVVNVTSSVTLHSECGITGTEFTYPIPPDANCYQYNFTVTAVNIVGRGEPATVTYTGLQTIPEIDGVELLNVTTTAGSIPYFIYLFTMTEFLCDGNVTLVNLDTNSSVSMQEFSFVREGDDRFLLSINLNFSRYNATVEAYNSAGFAVSYTLLNSHSIIDASATADNSGIHRVETDYNDRINETGALYVFIRATLSESTLVALNRTVSRDHILPYDSSSGNSMIHVYDINRDGVLLSGDAYPASTKELVTGPSIQLNFHHLEGCSASRVPRLISINCEYSSDSLAIGFQAVVYNTLTNLKGKIHVNQTVNPETSTTIEVEENGQYLVFVIPVLPETGITNASLEYMSVILDQQGPAVATVPVPSNNTAAYVVLVFGICILLAAVVMAVLVVIFFHAGECTRDKEKKPVQNEDGKSAVEIEGTNVRNDGDHPAKGVAGVCSVGTDDEANAQTLPTDINEDENLGYQSECAHVLINLDAELLQTPSHVVVKYDDIADTMKTCASKWKSIAEGLGFHEYEIEELEEKPRDDILGSVIRNWSQWRPGDSRGSKRCPNMEDLEAVLRNIDYPDVAKKLKAYRSSVILPHNNIVTTSEEITTL